MSVEQFLGQLVSVLLVASLAVIVWIFMILHARFPGALMAGILLFGFGLVLGFFFTRLFSSK